MLKENQGCSSFSSTDEEFKKKILGTHAPGVAELDVKPVLSIIEDILIGAKPFSTDKNISPGSKNPSHSDTSDSGQVHWNSHSVAEIVRMLECPINYTSYVMTWKCVGGVHSTTLTMELLASLSKYSWDAKVVITYAAFAINYGEFWLLHQLQGPKNQLANSIATLVGFPNATALGRGQSEMELKAVLDLLTAGLKLTYCIIQFREILSIDNISHQSPESLPMAVYWVIRSLVVCASTITNLFANFDQYITTSSGENMETLLGLASKLSAMLQPLKKQLKILKGKVEAENRYNVLKSSEESAGIDNIRVFSALINSRENQTPLYDGAKRTKEGLEVLRLKHVLLLISDLSLPPEELHVLHLIKNEHLTRHNYEVLWLPIVDPTKSMTMLEESQFYNHRNSMPWYSVEHPSFVDPVAIRYIREDLRFEHRPMLLLLDPHGKLLHQDALPMLWIWGSKAFPFTKDRETELWGENDWNIDLLVDDIYQPIQEWINSNELICLYGGDDIDWIRKFTKSARAAAWALNIPLQMLYVGRRNPKKKVQACHKVIARENLSDIFAVEYDDYVWYFWVRIASMWNSMKQMGRTVDDDRIMEGIMELLTFDGSEKGWALFSRANYEITMAKGDKLLPVLDNYKEWANEVDHTDNFVPVLDKHLRSHQSEEYGSRRILPSQTGHIPKTVVVCSVCSKILDNHND